MDGANGPQTRDVAQEKTLMVPDGDGIKSKKMQLQLPLVYQHFQLAYKWISRIKLITVSSTGPFFCTQENLYFGLPRHFGIKCQVFSILIEIIRLFKTI